jgi:hypothetical protein
MRYSTFLLLLLFIGRTPQNVENPEEAKILARRAMALAIEENYPGGE